MLLSESVVVMLLLPTILFSSGVDAASVIENSLKQEKKIANAVRPKSTEDQQIIPLLMHLNTKWRQMRSRRLRRLEAAKLNYLKQKNMSALQERLKRDEYAVKIQSNSESANGNSKDRILVPLIETKNCTIKNKVGECEEGLLRKNPIDVDEDYLRNENYQIDYQDLFNLPDKETNSIYEEYTDHKTIDILNEIFSDKSSLQKSHLKELDSVNESENNNEKIVHSEIEDNIKHLNEGENHTNSNSSCKPNISGNCNRLLNNDTKHHKEGKHGSSHSHGRAQHTHGAHRHNHTNTTQKCEENRHGTGKESKEGGYQPHLKHVDHQDFGDDRIHVLKNRPHKYLKHYQVLMTHCLQHFRMGRERPQHGVVETEDSGSLGLDQSQRLEAEQNVRLRAANRFCQERVHSLMAKRHGSHGHLAHRPHLMIAPGLARGDYGPSPQFLALILTALRTDRNDKDTGSGNINVGNNTEGTVTIAAQPSSKIPDETTARTSSNTYARYEKRLQNVVKELEENSLKKPPRKADKYAVSITENWVVPRPNGIVGMHTAGRKLEIPSTGRRKANILTVQNRPTSVGGNTANKGLDSLMHDETVEIVHFENNNPMKVTKGSNKNNKSNGYNEEATLVKQLIKLLKRRARQLSKGPTKAEAPGSDTQSHFIYKSSDKTGKKQWLKQRKEGRNSVTSSESLIFMRDMLHQENPTVNTVSTSTNLNQQTEKPALRAFDKQYYFIRNEKNPNQTNISIDDSIFQTNAEYHKNNSKKRQLTTENPILTDRDRNKRNIDLVNMIEVDGSMRKIDLVNMREDVMNPSSSFCPEITLDDATKTEVGVNVRSSPALLLFALLFSFCRVRDLL